jgi:hypothetical protein
MTFLQITLNVAPKNRSAAAEVYKKYKAPFLSDIPGAESKKLLIRNEDVQVVHGFDTVENAKGYLSSRLFNSDVVVALMPYLEGNPDVRIYETANDAASGGVSA